MEHKIPTLSSALSNHPESFFINNGAKVRFGTELKLTICHGIAPMRKRIPPVQGGPTTIFHVT